MSYGSFPNFTKSKEPNKPRNINQARISFTNLLYQAVVVSKFHEQEVSTIPVGVLDRATYLKIE